MQYTLIIKGKLDNLNDYITACRSSRYAGAELKHKNEDAVLCAIYEQLDFRMSSTWTRRIRGLKW